PAACKRQHEHGKQHSHEHVHRLPPFSTSFGSADTSRFASPISAATRCVSASSAATSSSRFTAAASAWASRISVSLRPRMPVVALALRAPARPVEVNSDAPFSRAHSPSRRLDWRSQPSFPSLVLARYQPPSRVTTWTTVPCASSARLAASANGASRMRAARVSVPVSASTTAGNRHARPHARMIFQFMTMPLPSWLVQAYGLCAALHLEFPVIDEAEHLAAAPARFIRNEHARDAAGEPLYPAGKVNGIADGGV